MSASVRKCQPTDLDKRQADWIARLDVLIRELDELPPLTADRRGGILDALDLAMEFPSTADGVE
jgi:hypothetical protein